MSIFRFKKRWQSQGQGGYYYAALASVDRNAKGHIDIPAQVNVDGITCAVEEISENAFRGCVYVTSVFCPDSVKTIGKRGDTSYYGTTTYLSHAFNCCCRLVCVSISNNVTFIGMASFEGCPHLKHFIVRKVQEKSKISGWMLPKEDFEKCTLYTDASDIINNKTTDVFGAKKGVSVLPPIEVMLKELETIPEPSEGQLRFSLWTAHQTALQSWSDAKVYGTETSENIIVPEVVFLQEQNGKYICSLSPKDGFSPYIVSSVGSSAFRGRQNLKTIYLPDTIKEIGDRDHSNVASTYEINYNSDCFDGCSKLESINMPDRVSFIGTSPFSNCFNLKRIIIRDTGLKQMAVSTWRLNKTECQNIEVLVPSKYVSQIEKLKVFKHVIGYDHLQLKTTATSTPIVKEEPKLETQPSPSTTIAPKVVQSDFGDSSASEIVALKKEIATKDDQIVALKSENTRLKQQLASIEANYKELASKMAAATAAHPVATSTSTAKEAPKPQPKPEPRPAVRPAPATTDNPKANAVFKQDEYKSKGKLCHTIVKTYVEQHSDVTLAQLKQAFNVPKCEVVESLAVALTIKDSTGKVGGDYYIKENDQLKAKDGMVVVWSYWPERFYNPFMERVKTLGYTIE